MRDDIIWLKNNVPMRKRELLSDKTYLKCVSDLIEHPLIRSMNFYYMHGGNSCLAHSLDVSYLSYKFCKKYGFNYKAAARAGLLHDFFLYDWHDKYFAYHLRYLHGISHPRIALKNAKQHFHLSKLEENAILRHMFPFTPLPPRSVEGIIISHFDKCCAFCEKFA